MCPERSVTYVSERSKALEKVASVARPGPSVAGSENWLLRSSTAPNNACIRGDRRLAPKWRALLLGWRGRTPAGDTIASLALLRTSDTRSRIKLSATCCAGTESHPLRNG